MKALKRSNETYFEELPQAVQDLVRELIIEAAEDRNGPDGWKPNDECIENVECHSRDGFIPFSHNKGGLEYNNFTQLSDYWGGGYSVAHAKAQAEIERQIEYSLQCAHETFETNNAEELKGIPADKRNYHDLYELGHGKLAEKLSNTEHENLCGDESSIMHSFRFLYHGCEDGIHSASVSAAVNTEGPYHRSHISWAPNVFCEGAKEVEITWRTESGLKRKLKKALADVSKAIF